MPTDLEYLIEQFGKLQDKVSRIEQRHERNSRFGTTEQVDAKNHLVRMRIGGTDAAPMLSPWVPVSQTAGNRKVHSLPSVGQPGSSGGTSGGSSGGAGQPSGGAGGASQKKKGQTLLLVSPDGDFEQAFVIPYTWSNDNAAPSNDPDKDADTRGASVWWQKDGDVQQQVSKSSWHVTGGNHHARVGDSRDGSDSLTQETSPKSQSSQDQVHYSDTDASNGITRSVSNDKHKITIHPSKGIQHIVNNQPTQQSTPGPGGTPTANTHFSLLDLAKGLLHSVANGQHTIGIDPSKGITHNTTKAILRTAVQSIMDQGSKILHNGPTNVSSTLSVQSLLSGFGGASIGFGGGGNLSQMRDHLHPFALSALESEEPAIGAGPTFTIGPTGASASGGFVLDFLAVLAGLDVIGGLIADKVFVNLPNFIDDAQAAAGGVAVGQLYRNGNFVMVRGGGAAFASPGMFFFGVGASATLTYTSGVQPVDAVPGAFGLNGHDGYCMVVQGGG